MKSLSALLALAALAATSALAQMSQPMVDENPTKIRDCCGVDNYRPPTRPINEIEVEARLKLRREMSWHESE
jgi:hypothetical protein